jgi:phosphinothricin acetyltransferase
MGDVSIRPATPDDAAAICTIYNQGIEDRIATLETDLRTPEERREWMGARAARHPVVVAVTGGQVVGWGSLNAFNARPAYDNVVDLSVYSTTFPYNEAGVALYQKMGFRPVGVYHEQGRLDGRWVDVLIMEHLL